MFAFSWLRHLQRRWFGRPALRRVPVRRVRPRLEVLEDRLTPSVVTINVNDNSDQLDNPANATVSGLGAQVSLRDAINAAATSRKLPSPLSSGEGLTGRTFRTRLIPPMPPAGGARRN